jgi:hypothetical protein
MTPHAYIPNYDVATYQASYELASSNMRPRDGPQEDSSPRIIMPLKVLPTRQEPSHESFSPDTLWPRPYLHPLQYPPGASPY